MNLIKINDVANKNSVFNYILNSLINENLTAIIKVEKLNMLSQHTMAWYLVSLIICRGSGSATEYPMMVGPNTLARLVRGILQSGISPTLYKNRPVKNLYQKPQTLYKTVKLGWDFGICYLTKWNMGTFLVSKEGVGFNVRGFFYPSRWEEVGLGRGSWW